MPSDGQPSPGPFPRNHRTRSGPDSAPDPRNPYECLKSTLFSRLFLSQNCYKSMSTSFRGPCQLHSGVYINFIPGSMSTWFRGPCQLHSGVYVNFIPGSMSTWLLMMTTVDGSTWWNMHLYHIETQQRLSTTTKPKTKSLEPEEQTKTLT